MRAAPPRSAVGQKAGRRPARAAVQALCLAALHAGRAAAAPAAPAPNCTLDQLLQAEKLLRDTLLSTYDRSVLPAPRPIEVVVSGTVTKVNSIDSRQQTFKLNMYWRHEWSDSRLRWNPADYCGVDFRYNFGADKVWKPDTFFANANEQQSVGGEEFLHVRSNGRVYWSRRIVLTFFCSMSFSSYPFDSQDCSTRIESYGYPASLLTYHLPEDAEKEGYETKWKKAVGLLNADQLSAGTFRMSAPTAELEKQSALGSDSFSGVIIRFTFRRQRMRYMVTLFFPLWLVTSLSYLGLFINPAVAPARVAMAVTTVLVLVSLMFVLTKEIPQNITYMSGMDALFFLCILFVWANTVEYVIVNYLNTSLTVNEEDIRKRKKLRKGAGVGSPTHGAGKLSRQAKAVLRAELDDIFRLFDRCGTGSIDMNDVAAIFRSLAQDRAVTLSPERIDELVMRIDSDGSGTVEFPEFVDFINAETALCAELGLDEPAAVSWCGRGVSRRSVRLFEAAYRRIVGVVFVCLWCLWFAWNASDMSDSEGTVVFMVVLGASLVLLGLTIWAGPALAARKKQRDAPAVQPYRPAVSPRHGGGGQSPAAAGDVAAPLLELPRRSQPQQKSPAPLPPPAQPQQSPLHPVQPLQRAATTPPHQPPQPQQQQPAQTAQPWRSSSGGGGVTVSTRPASPQSAQPTTTASPPTTAVPSPLPPSTAAPSPTDPRRYRA